MRKNLPYPGAKYARLAPTKLAFAFMTGEKNNGRGHPKENHACTKLLLSLPSIPSSTLSPTFLFFSFLLFFSSFSPLKPQTPLLFSIFFFYYCPASLFLFYFNSNQPETNTFFDCCLFVSYSTVFPLLLPVFARGKIVIILISSPFVPYSSR